jgi:hypothetical protein
MPKFVAVLRHSFQYLLFVAPVHGVVPGWVAASVLVSIDRWNQIEKC